MRRAAVLLLAAVGLALGTPDARAANVHLKGKPVITAGVDTLTFSGALAGLGNQDVTISIQAKGMATTLCANPAGMVVPGQNKVPVLEDASTTIAASEIKN